MTSLASPIREVGSRTATYLKPMTTPLAPPPRKAGSRPVVTSWFHLLDRQALVLPRGSGPWWILWFHLPKRQDPVLPRDSASVVAPRLRRLIEAGSYAATCSVFVVALRLRLPKEAGSRAAMWLQGHSHDIIKD
jgi:hypothetical protein